MFLLVPAHPGFPGQIPQSRKTVVCVCVCLWCCPNGKPLTEFTSSFNECRLSTSWPPTLKPGQLTWAVSPTIGCCHLHLHHYHLSLQGQLPPLSLFIFAQYNIFSTISTMSSHTKQDSKALIKHQYTHNCFTALLEYVQDHPGEQVPER